MTQWLLDTFVLTSVLIAAVLLLRGPVARHFGPQVAYALWALPLLRLLMPPLVLPANFAPVEAEPAAAAALVLVREAPVAEAGFALTDLLLPLWLGGAVLFLVWRAADYLRMRRELLADARPVGEAGAVRLVETPDVASPVAFGLRDKVVALPVGFMAQHDLSARDLALAHELAHHRGHDLLANLAAQPLLALHWFNPLAWLGWRAMRSDQEAACDARVIAGCERAERAAYAQVIATFAAGPRLALAAPMACPVLGEKSIIHRLRSLTMADVSTTRRRLGFAAIAASALVSLGLTASVSYAQDKAKRADEPAADSQATPAAEPASDVTASPQESSTIEKPAAKPEGDLDTAPPTDCTTSDQANAASCNKTAALDGVAAQRASFASHVDENAVRNAVLVLVVDGDLSQIEARQLIFASAEFAQTAAICSITPADILTPAPAVLRILTPAFTDAAVESDQTI